MTTASFKVAALEILNYSTRVLKSQNVRVFLNTLNDISHRNFAKITDLNNRHGVKLSKNNYTGQMED